MKTFIASDGSLYYAPKDQLSGAFVNAELARLRRIESAAREVLEYDVGAQIGSALEEKLEALRSALGDK